MFALQVPEGSALAEKTLSETRLGSLMGLNVLGITRKGRSILAPSPFEKLQAQDILTVEGAAKHIDRLKSLQQNLKHFKIETVTNIAELLVSDIVKVAEIALTKPPVAVTVALEGLLLAVLVAMLVAVVAVGAGAVETGRQKQQAAGQRRYQKSFRPHGLSS